MWINHDIYIIFCNHELHLLANKTRFILMLKHKENGARDYRSYIIAEIISLFDMLLLKCCCQEIFILTTFAPPCSSSRLVSTIPCRFSNNLQFQKLETQCQLGNWVAGPIIPLSWSGLDRVPIWQQVGWGTRQGLVWSRKGFQLWMWSLSGFHQAAQNLFSGAF